MRKRNQIKNCFENAIECLEKYDLSQFSKYINNQVETNISLIGKKTNGKEELIKNLEINTELNISRWWISNVCIRTSNDFAVMSAYLTIMLGNIDDKQFLHSVEFGGKVVAQFSKESKEWLISNVKYDLDWINGNSLILKQYNLIDYTRKYNSDRCINITDAPWKIIKENDEQLTDEEKIKETMGIYCFAVDNNDMSSLRLAETEDIHWLWDSPFDSYIVATDIESHVKYFQNPKNFVSRRQHPVRVVNVDITGNEATMNVYLLRKNHVRSSELNITNIDTQFYNSVYINKLRKENNIWKLYDMKYRYYELPQENGFAHKHYVD